MHRKGQIDTNVVLERKAILKRITSEEGYALASVLLLVTILSSVAASVITLQYLQKQRAISEVNSVKAEYAAGSGIARFLSVCNSGGEISRLTGVDSSAFNFQDGSRAGVRIAPWGMFYIVTSEGYCGRSKMLRTALVADRPSNLFENALLFGNPSHQIVFAGGSSIKGNVIVGRPGVTTGSLRNRRTPPRIPIEGTITKQPNPQVPAFSPPHLQEMLNEYGEYLSGRRGRHKVEISSQGPNVIRSGAIADSIDCVIIHGSTSIVASIIRRSEPLYIVVQGKVNIEAQASLGGLVAIIASGSISIASTVSTEDALFFSAESVFVAQGAGLMCQIVSPKVQISPNAQLHYPSVVFSARLQNPNTKQGIVIDENASVEGLVGLVSSGTSNFEESLINIKTNAKVVGAVYSENTITLDGTVVGTVLTKDFYFYESPTTYMGWVRDGKIDRSLLPKGFLVPPGLSTEMKLDVLDWL